MGRTKYTVIERTEYNSIALTADALELVRANPACFGVILAEAPVTLKQIREHNYRTEDIQYVEAELATEKRHQEFQEFREKYHKKPLQATVAWFDWTSGQGVVGIENVGRFVLYACNIKGRKTWYPETACVYYEKGQQVTVELDCHAMHSIFCMGLTQGTLDVAGWDRIKDQNLAFRCDDEGNAVTGLFA